MHQPLAVEGRHIGVGDTIEYMDNRGLWWLEGEAARAHDTEGARLGRQLNFPEEWEDVEDIEEKYEALSYKRKRRASSSKYQGACFI